MTVLVQFIPNEPLPISGNFQAKTWLEFVIAQLKSHRESWDLRNSMKSHRERSIVHNKCPTNAPAENLGISWFFLRPKRFFFKRPSFVPRWASSTMRGHARPRLKKPSLPQWWLSSSHVGISMEDGNPCETRNFQISTVYLFCCLKAAEFQEVQDGQGVVRSWQ